MLGRFLDTSTFEQLAEQTKLKLSVSPSDAPVGADWIGDARQGLAYSPIALDEQPDLWKANTTLADLFDQPVLTLRVDTPRDITARGEAAVRTSLLSLAATGLLTMFVMWLLLRYTLLRPISQLTEHAVRVGADDDLHSRLNMNRKDELGVLARTFDEMVDRLAEARRRLVDQSFKSGVAEMASGVLHNIGNAVTPLNVRLSTLSRDLRMAPVAEMEQAAAELAEPATPPERREGLVQFVELAGVELTGLVKRSRDEVAAAAQQVVHVQEILADQERFSRSARVIEPVNMDSVIRDAASGLSAEMKVAMRIDIDPSVVETGAVAGARAALHQMVTNLLVNAAESVQAAGSDAGRVTITAAPEEVQGQLMAHLRFTDNGAGIQAEYIDRLFESGFSTKGRSGSGLGLHWSANTVQSLGGRISVESTGPGEGACLHVLLPLAQTLALQATGTEG